jgi:hypothetical protein
MLPFARVVTLTSLTCCLAALSADAGVVKLVIEKTLPYAEGKAFGEVGAYRRLIGKVHFAADPIAAANQQVVDLPLAPRNQAGLVEWSADFEILVPVDPARGNRAVLYDVNNRGGRLALGQFSSGADDFLMRQGYTVVWSGWLAETVPGQDRLRMQAPVATNQGQPITGITRSEIVVDEVKPKHTLSQWANQGSYPPTERGLREATLTWRLREKDERVAIPREQWRLEEQTVEADGQRGQLPLIELVVAGGLQPGCIYELVYETQGPIVQGLGLAGIRDLVSFLRHDKSDQNPLRLAEGVSAAKYTYAFGVSQSGRCLRQFLYDGFNADEAGRAVFDGVIPHVAGGGLGFYNHRFALPTRTNGQHDNHLYPADVFPFAYGDQRDPYTGRVDGILRRSRAANVVPKVFHTQSSSEYWHRSGSLVHTDPLGQRDAEIPPEVRIYTYGGTQHGAGSGTPVTGGLGQQIRNPADYRPLNRALLTALDAWVRTGKEPPASVYPKIADGTLAGWRQAESGWQPVPGVQYPQVIQQPENLDRGPEWFTLRRTAIEPPASRGQHYGVKVPAFDRDNRELGCLDLPCVRVSVATYTGWNLRNRAAGAEGELWGLAGGYIPLAKTASERQASGDPRRSLEERYENFAGYRTQYETYARELTAQRYLLEEDLPRLRALVAAREKLFERGE